MPYLDELSAAATTVGASESHPLELRLGPQVAYVDTGGPLPEGTDSVVIIENVQPLDGDRIEPGSFFLEQTQDFDRAEGLGGVENPVRERCEGGVKALEPLEDGLGAVDIKGCSVGFAEGFRVEPAGESHFRSGSHGQLIIQNAEPLEV